ncbi:MAG: hypothetical protein HFJ46_05130 [Clostridia bacterium]|nr:hypothetical protein [Clostridia bacterium]
MSSSILNFYSEKSGEIDRFLKMFFSQSIDNENKLFWKKDYENPIEMIDIISCFIDNNDKFDMNLWISLDENVFILINEKNINSIIKYIYERYPW